MSDTPPILGSNNEVPKKTTSSLLDDIMLASKQTSPQRDLEGNTDMPNAEPPKIKSPREPISMALFLKLIGSLLFVAIIFFGSFLAYIAFNPAQAVFFTNTFNIDPNDVQNLLKKLINGSFWFIMIIVSIAWIVSLFRAVWVPRELKRKKLLSWLTASLIGLLLFAILTFWAFLFRQVGATDYSNPSGTILIYDQALYTSEKYKINSRVYNTSNLIGPIDVFFDIRGNAEMIAKNNLYTIDSFDINFDGAKCSNGRSAFRGTNPQVEQSIVCTFDEVKAYNLVWTYSVTSRDGQSKTLDMILPSIEVRGLVTISRQVNNRGQKIITLDANNLKKLGSTQWIYESGKSVKESFITETMTSVPQWLCLKLFETTWCDRLFLLEDKNDKSVEWSILSIQDTTDRNLFQFSLSGVTVKANEIVDIEWLLDGQNIICRGWSEICNYRFSTYGKKNIKATVKIASGEKYTFEIGVVVNEPLSIIRRIKVLNDAGAIMNTEETYDSGLRAFVLKNAIIPPESLTFDARDIVSWNAWYSLSWVLWKIANGKTTEERRGDKISIEFNQPLRYTIDAFYTFTKSVPGEKAIEDTLKETVIIDIERKSLMPRMMVSASSDYVPALVSIDASQSASENGEIKKFIFDFGEGKTPAEGDSIRQYQYTTPGEKTITLTIVSDIWEKTSIKKTIVLKDQIKTIDFSPSISPGTVWSAVDFESVGTTGQIEDYIWNFGDNTPVSRGFTASHTYTTPGTYMVSLTIVYGDGTQQTKKKSYEVVIGS